MGITDYVLRALRIQTSPIKRAKIFHELVDDFVKEMTTHPLIIEHSGCQKGCAACCHTEVSVTPDEAELLALRVKDGVSIDWSKLHLQKTQIEEGKNFYQIPYELRSCVFLGEENQCRVYDDRPSVCRTNMVIGNSDQCSTKDGEMKEMRLVKTEKADMAIIAGFMTAPNENDLLPSLVWKVLNREVGINSKLNTPGKKVSKDQNL